MKRLIYSVFTFIAFLNNSLQASEGSFPSPEKSIQEITNRFPLHKVFDAPPLETEFSSSLNDQKLIVLSNEDNLEFLKMNPRFQGILTMPKVQIQTIEGSYDNFLRGGNKIEGSSQGIASFKQLPQARKQPFYLGSTSFLNCVGVVLDHYETLPILNGFMHVDEKEFLSGRFERLLNKFESTHKHLTKITLTSCYFSPLLDEIVNLLVTSGFNIAEVDVDLAYHTNSYKVVPLFLTGLSMEEVLSCSSFQDFYSKVKTSGSIPKMIIYDFLNHSHVHLGFNTAEENNRYLHEYFQLAPSKRNFKALLQM
jgi:hypothetical protein